MRMVEEHQLTTVRVELADTVEGGDGHARPQLASGRIVEADRGFRQTEGEVATIGGEGEDRCLVLHHLPGRPAADVPEDDEGLVTRGRIDGAQIATVGAEV